MKQFIIFLSFTVAASVACIDSFAQQPAAKTIGVGDNKTTMLVFPSGIIDADRGSDGVSIRVNKKTPTVLKVKATEGTFSPTNLTVYTEDGRMYMTHIYYDSLAGDKAVLFNATDDGIPVLSQGGVKGSVSVQEVKDIAARLARFPKRLRRPSVEGGGVTLSLTNIWYRSEYLFFQFTIRNRSAIPFELQFARYYIRDNHRGKRSSIAEQEVVPAYTFSYPGERTPAEGSSTVVVVFSKFTIADNRHLSAEWFEAAGDRDLTLSLKGKKLLRTKPLP